MLSAGLHETTFPPRNSKNLFVLVLSCPAQKQNPKDFAVLVGTPRPMDSALTPALSIAIVCAQYGHLLTTEK
ncbi:hypothetical protein B4Q04_22370 [Zobellia sp. OII3]|nr:hypothetical protein B4Q04_22370 [Zobellia sp. OII3]